MIRVPRNGHYEISLQRGGETSLGVNGHTVLTSLRSERTTRLVDDRRVLQADRSYSLEATWYSVNGRPLPQLGFEDVSPLIAAAVRGARTAHVALVFAGELQGEGIDRPSLDLPGYGECPHRRCLQGQSPYRGGPEHGRRRSHAVAGQCPSRPRGLVPR